jgi:DNA-binding HxlR family transcriptional regulator
MKKDIGFSSYSILLTLYKFRDLSFRELYAFNKDKLSKCAVKFSLVRLLRKGLVTRTGKHCHIRYFLTDSGKKFLEDEYLKKRLIELQ